MLFILATPMLIRHLWQLQRVVFLQWCLLPAVLLCLVVFLYTGACFITQFVIHVFSSNVVFMRKSVKVANNIKKRQLTSKYVHFPYISNLQSTGIMSCIYLLRNLQMALISQSACHQQDFLAQCNLMLQVIRPNRELRRK